MDKPCCPDWEPNIDKLNGPIMMQAARSGFMWQYDGLQFRFCPWCGTQIPEPQREDSEQEKK